MRRSECMNIYKRTFLRISFSCIHVNSHKSQCQYVVGHIKPINANSRHIHKDIHVNKLERSMRGMWYAYLFRARLMFICFFFQHTKTQPISSLHFFPWPFLIKMFSAHELFSPNFVTTFLTKMFSTHDSDENRKIASISILFRGISNRSIDFYIVRANVISECSIVFWAMWSVWAS